LVAGSSPARVTCGEVALSKGAPVTVSQTQRIITPVTWLFAPEWLTVEQACELSGHDRGVMLHIVETGGVDLKDTDDGTVLIEKRSLYEFQEALALVLHWNE
jgi:hypothetical protein